MNGPLTKHQISLLQEAASSKGLSSYMILQKTIMKLHGLGLIQKAAERGLRINTYYRITDKGSDCLRDLQGAGKIA